MATRGPGPEDKRARRIRLILTDVDGTILPKGASRVSDRTISAFHAALDAGIRVGPASGRGFFHIPSTFGGDATCCATCMANNGMHVFLDGECVHRQLLPRGPIAQLAELVRGVEHAGLIYFEDGVPMMVEGDEDDLRSSFPLYADEYVRVYDVPDHDIEKANVFVAGDLDATRRVIELLARDVRGVALNLPLAGFINVLPVGWSKAKGIDVLCDAMGIGLDQVVVFGDGGNDVEMLAHVPHSVAVAGAAPEAAEAARWQTGRCEDDAVAQAIEKIVAGTWPFA